MRPSLAFLLDLLLCRTIIFFALVKSSKAISLTNITVDDAGSDSITGYKPVYNGPEHDPWERRPHCQCPARVQADATQAFANTWHDSAFHISDGGPKTIQFTFKGSAIYVYFIIANNLPNVTTNTNVTFFIDSEEAGFYEHPPAETQDIIYNVPVFTLEDIELESHNLTVASRGDNPSAILFDYLVYSTDSGKQGSSEGNANPTGSGVLPTGSGTLPSSNHSSLSAGLIAGIAVGSACILAIVLSLILLCRRRSRRANQSDLVVKAAFFERDQESGASLTSIRNTKLPLQLPQGADSTSSVPVQIPPRRPSPPNSLLSPATMTTLTIEPRARGAWAWAAFRKAAEARNAPAAQCGMSFTHRRTSRNPTIMAERNPKLSQPTQDANTMTTRRTLDTGLSLASLNRQMSMLMNEVGRLREQQHSTLNWPPLNEVSDDLPPPPQYPQ